MYDIAIDPGYLAAQESQDDDAPETTRTLSLNFTETNSETDGGVATDLVVTLDGSRTEYLPTVMEAFEKVLHAMGFDYVSLVNISASGHGTYGYGRVN